MKNKEFLRSRAKAVVMDVRKKPETCKVARKWFDLAHVWALPRDIDFALELKEIEKGII